MADRAADHTARDGGGHDRPGVAAGDGGDAGAERGAAQAAEHRLRVVASGIGQGRARKGRKREQQHDRDSASDEVVHRILQ
jgi:hypothetical protein